MISHAVVTIAFMYSYVLVYTTYTIFDVMVYSLLIIAIYIDYFAVVSYSV